MSCFAAGMLLALAICHILPEANESYEEIVAEEELHEEHRRRILSEDDHDDHDDHEEEEHGHGHAFPLPFVLFMAGFLLLLLLDQVLFKQLPEEDEPEDPKAC
eukprot:CAMPEP_0170490094 /NCGR_PEP_ID=MMETSP0208-20121228/8362_1 /TAXON_ID=197538 /ORGANISM="Strombidium inclinatum, Strain S3" /LENGTH=102 /DNA_ID=CAMNT_0010765329 /DNA_START=102 /DNA_END=410 /DNA_ORIENTATION=-